ncbi:MAG TPA: DUF3299 domain-containing protein [Lacipirellula sp.]
MKTLGPLAAVIALLSAGGCDMSSSRLGQTEQSVAPAIERAASIEAAAAAGAKLPQPTANSKAIGIPEGAPKVDASGVMESTFDDLKFEMDKSAMFERSMLTPKVESLFDKRIRLRGYMFPTLQRRGIKQFVLVRDNMECCFGPGAALYDCVLVTMEPGTTAEYTIRPIAVEGTFRLEPLMGPDRRPLAIYQMTAEAVE